MVDHAPFAARVGTSVLSQWRLDSLLGVGGMAAVYAATGPSGEKVALKILHREYKDSAAVVRRFRREADVGKDIDHPSIVRVHDASFRVVSDSGSESEVPIEDTDEKTERTEKTTVLVTTEDDEPFLVMDLLEGETIRDEWRRSGRTLPLFECLHIAERVVDCLIACHEAGIVHRDLKPANLFRTASGQIKILDFGVAQIEGSELDRSAQGTALGTPAYMAPEQAMGLATEFDGRTDLFAVGAILHALITGHRLHVARTEKEAILLAATKPVPSIVQIAPNLPAPVVRLVDKALAWDRRNRFADAREMHDAILAAMTLVEAWHNDALDQALLPPPESIAPTRAATSMVVPGLPLRPSLAALAVSSLDRDGAKKAYALLDDVLFASREFPWDHPAVLRALARACDALSELFAREPSWGELVLRPYAFTANGTTVWEPPSPFDGIPYHLFEASVRTLTLSPELRADELQRLLAILVRDPELDMAFEDDHATLMWEAEFEHISYRLADPFAKGGGAERAAFVREMTAIESSLEDVLATLPAGDADAEEDPALAAPFTEADAELTERHVAALSRAFAYASKAGDVAHMLRALRDTSEAELSLGRFDELCTFFERMCNELRVLEEPADVREAWLVSLADALFGGPAFVLLGRYLARAPSDILLARPILELLGPGDMPRALELARDAAPELREAFLAYAVRVAKGREAALSDATEGLDTETAFAFVEALARITSDAGRAELAKLAASDRIEVSVAARVLSEPRAADRELARLLADKNPARRSAAIRIATVTQKRELLPAIAEPLGKPNDMPPAEAKERMRALLLLGEDSGEAHVLEMAKRGGIFVSAERERLRAAACAVLGELSTSALAERALGEVSRARLGTSDEVRNAARRALGAIRARLSEEEAAG